MWYTTLLVEHMLLEFLFLEGALSVTFNILLLASQSCLFRTALIYGAFVLIRLPWVSWHAHLENPWCSLVSIPWITHLGFLEALLITGIIALCINVFL